MASAAYVSRDEKTFAVHGTPDVTLQTFDGSIEVRSWDQSSVHVTIERHAQTEAEAKALQVETRQDGNQITVEVKRPSGFSFHWFGQSPSARLIVSVPRTANLAAASGDGSVSASDITGRMHLHSGDGSITGSRLNGDLEVDTGDGSVKLDGISGTLQARSGDGSVHAQGKLSAVNVRTGDGSIALALDSGSAMNGDWSIATGDGSVSLDLPSDFNAEVDAHSGDGDVSIAGGLKLMISGPMKVPRHDLRGTLGHGGHMLSVRSGDGSIVLK
jgi:hypothetical protein